MIKTYSFILSFFWGWATCVSGVLKICFQTFGNFLPGNWTWHWLKWARRVIKRWNPILWAIVTCTSFKIIRFLFFNVEIFDFIFVIFRWKCSMFAAKNKKRDRSVRDKLRTSISTQVRALQTEFQFTLDLRRPQSPELREFIAEKPSMENYYFEMKMKNHDYGTIQHVVIGS